MVRGRLAARGDNIARWLLPASVVHAAFVLVGALWLRTLPEPATPPLGSLEPQASLELMLLDDGEGATAPLVLTPPLRATSRRGSAAARPAGVAKESQPATVSSLEVANATPPLPGDDDPASVLASDEPPGEAGPKLSLDQLGLVTNPFRDIASQPLTKEERTKARLHAALHPLSPGRELGPVADAARRLVLDDDRLVESNAILNVRVDAVGHVTEVHVLETSSQSTTWQLIAARLARALAPAKLRADGSQQGWDMKLRLSSTVQLPSGAAPGMRLGVLGRQVAGGGGPGSTSLELSPTPKLDLKEPIDSIGRHLDDPMRFEVMLLKWRADPTDINATARRVVEVAVLSIDPAAMP
jgi:hypothetical protein